MKRSQANTLLGIAALVTSVVAVLVSWQDSRLTRASQRASFMPLLEVEMYGDADTDPMFVEITVRNVGSGVAVVQDSVLYANNGRIDTYDQLADAFLTPALRRPADLSWDTLQGYIQPSEEVAMMTFRWPRTDALHSEFINYTATTVPQVIENLRLDICYCSVFGECWRGGHPWTPKPQKVRRCAPGEDSMLSIWRSFVAERAETNP